jgi:hypothetical protein
VNAARPGLDVRHLAVVMLAAVLAVAGCTASGPGNSSGVPATTGAAISAPASGPAAVSPSPQVSAAPVPLPSSTPLPPATWAKAKTAGDAPKPREDHTWTVSEDGSTAYLFGGRNGTTDFGDLWAYDLRADRWRVIEPAGPGPHARFGHEAVWLAGRGLVVFAGQATGKFFNDLWLFDPGQNRWTLLPAGGQPPVPRYGTCASMGPDGRLWMSHGFTEDGVRFADTHTYDFASGTWALRLPTGDGPIQRCLHACWWNSGGTFDLYGGQTTGVPALGDLWSLAPEGSPSLKVTWTKVAESKPPARQLPAVARHGTATVIVGGRGLDTHALADSWYLPDAPEAFSKLAISGSSPPARSGATLIDDPAGARMLFFGGKTDTAALADLWTLRWP